ncbi:MAG TPA: hypothetical protein VI009_12430, partial [Xanthobacteraceae bacterium]
VSKVPTAEMVDIHYFERVRAVNFADRFWVVLVVKAGFGASARHNQVRHAAIDGPVPFLPRARSHLARCLKAPPKSRSACDCSA